MLFYFIHLRFTKVPSAWQNLKLIPERNSMATGMPWILSPSIPFRMKNKGGTPRMRGRELSLKTILTSVQQKETAPTNRRPPQVEARDALAKQQTLKCDPANSSKLWRERKRLPGKLPNTHTLLPSTRLADTSPRTGNETGDSATSNAWVDVSALRQEPSFRRWVVLGSGEKAERRRGLGLVETLVGRWVQTKGTTGRRWAQCARNKGLYGRDSARRLRAGSRGADRGFSAN